MDFFMVMKNDADLKLYQGTIFTVKKIQESNS